MKRDSKRTLAVVAAVVAVAASGLLWARIADARRESASPSQTQLEVARSVAMRLAESGMAREPRGPTSATAEPDCLRALRAAWATQNPVAMGQAVETWFTTLQDPVGALLARLEHPSDQPDDVGVRAVLLASAMELAFLSAPQVAPWTGETLARAALARYGLGDDSAHAIASGLASSGDRLPGSMLGDLVHVQTAPGNRLSIQGQLAAFHLGDAWATTMGAGAEEALFDIVDRAEESSRAQGQAVRLLLTRDWRAFADVLLEHRGTRELDSDSRVAIDVQFIDFPEHLLPHERPEFVRSLVRTPGLAGLFLSSASDEVLRDVSTSISRDELAERQRHVFDLRTAADTWYEAGVELMGGDESISGMVLAAMIQRGAAGRPEFETLLARRFAGREADPAGFWMGVASAAGRVQDDAAILQSIVPLVEQSRGERSAGRDLLVSSLRSRFPRMSFE